MTSSVLLILGLGAASGEPTRDDLVSGSDRAGDLIARCQADPGACTDADARSDLGRAFFTRALDAWVHRGAVDEPAIGNLQHLDAELFSRLPEGLRGASAPPATWVVALSAPPRKPLVLPQEPEAVAVAAIAVPEPPPATGLALAHELERRGLMAAALLAAADAARSDEVSGATRLAASLARALGTRRPLQALAEAVHPAQWHPEAQSDGWLALGAAHQERGALSSALKAYTAVRPQDEATLEGQLQTGLIYWQVGKPWHALRAFRNASEALPDLSGMDGPRDLAVWNMATLYDELGRHEDAILHYEVLTIGQGPWSDRAALRCAWSAHQAGDGPRARKLLAGVDAAADPVSHALLQARLALIAGQAESGRAHLESSIERARAQDRVLSALLEDPAGLAGADIDSAAPGVALHPALAAARRHEAALVRDRNQLEPGDPMRPRLERAIATARAESASTAYYAISDVRRELRRQQASAERLRARIKTP